MFLDKTNIFMCLFPRLWDDFFRGFKFFLFFRNLAKSQQRLVKLGNALDKVDREVAEMRKRYALTAVMTTKRFHLPSDACCLSSGLVYIYQRLPSAAFLWN